MADDDHDTEYGMVLPFDTNDPKFARGFEAGGIWGRMQCREDLIEQTIHGTNTEMVMRMAEAAAYRFHADPGPGDWMHVTLAALEEDDRHA